VVVGHEHHLRSDPSPCSAVIPPSIPSTTSSIQQSSTSDAVQPGPLPTMPGEMKYFQPIMQNPIVPIQTLIEYRPEDDAIYKRASNPSLDLGCLSDKQQVDIKLYGTLYSSWKMFVHVSW
jgi:hypothetical protein